MCYENTLAHICWESSKPEMELVCETKDLFAKMYKETVISRMGWNGVDDEYKIGNAVILIPPHCMRKKSVRSILNVLKTFVEGITHVIKEQKYDSESDNNDEMDKEESEDCSSDCDSVVVVSRTVVDQGLDVLPMIKKARDMLNKKDQITGGVELKR